MKTILRSSTLLTIGAATVAMLTPVPASAQGGECSAQIVSSSQSATTGGGTATATSSGHADVCGTDVATGTTSTSTGDATASGSAAVSMSILNDALPEAVRRGAAQLGADGSYADIRGAVRVRGARTVIRGSGSRMTVRLPDPAKAVRENAGGTMIDRHERYTVSQTPMKASHGGGVVITFTMQDAQSPRSYPIDLRYSQDVRLERVGQSVLVVDTEGRAVGMLPKPWAKDADGKNVRTTYVIRGSKVVQKIFPTAGTAYPVVADPWVIPVWAVVQIIRCGAGAALGWIGSAGWAWYARAVAVVGGCLTGMR